MMNFAPVDLFLDCDPGIDDSIALLLAFGSPMAKVRSVTTVAGNRDIAVVTRTATALLRALGESWVPFGAGADAPLDSRPVRADSIHGALDRITDGIADDSELPKIQDGVAVLLNSTQPESRWAKKLVAMGPLTNIVHAVEADASLLDHIDEIVIMGGSTVGGNITPYAEFNFYGDPLAASLVLSYPWRKLSMVGLNVTSKVALTDAVMRRVESIRRPFGPFVANMVRSYRNAEMRAGAAAPTLHDAVVVAFAVRPDLFTARRTHIAVELVAQDRLGQTTEVGPAGAGIDHWLVEDVDVAGFWDLLVDALERLNQRLPDPLERR